MTTAETPQNIAIIGGGVAGLATAYELLRELGADAELNGALEQPVRVTLFEAGSEASYEPEGGSHRASSGESTARTVRMMGGDPTDQEMIRLTAERLQELERIRQTDERLKHLDPLMLPEAYAYYYNTLQADAGMNQHLASLAKAGLEEFDETTGKGDYRLVSGKTLKALSPEQYAEVKDTAVVVMRLPQTPENSASVYIASGKEDSKFTSNLTSIMQTGQTEMDESGRGGYQLITGKMFKAQNLGIADGLVDDTAIVVVERPYDRDKNPDSASYVANIHTLTTILRTLLADKIEIQYDAEVANITAHANHATLEAKGQQRTFEKVMIAAGHNFGALMQQDWPKINYQTQRVVVGALDINAFSDLPSHIPCVKGTGLDGAFYGFQPEGREVKSTFASQSNDAEGEELYRPVNETERRQAIAANAKRFGLDPATVDKNLHLTTCIYCNGPEENGYVDAIYPSPLAHEQARNDYDVPQAVVFGNLLDGSSSLRRGFGLGHIGACMLLGRTPSRVQGWRDVSLRRNHELAAQTRLDTSATIVASQAVQPEQQKQRA